MKLIHFRFLRKGLLLGAPHSYLALWPACKRCMNVSGGVRSQSYSSRRYGLRTTASLFLRVVAAGVTVKRHRSNA